MARIILTGGAGLIGSAVLGRLNQEGIDDILVVDHLGEGEAWRNLVGKRFARYMDRVEFFATFHSAEWAKRTEAVIHMGACSSTTERDVDYLLSNNTECTLALARWCAARGARFVCASSAAVYGNGAQGFSDDDALTARLCPLNPYGFSKLLADQTMLAEGLANHVAALRFFNVFGPNEHHKGPMRSMVCRAWEQITAHGDVALFRSYRPDFPDGGQRRDFVYVADCAEVIWWLLCHPDVNGIMNVGTGEARTWNDLAAAVFHAMDRPARIRYIDMPTPLRAQYQYHTQADLTKLRSAGCPVTFHTLEAAVGDYVANHLMTSQG